MQIDNSNIRKPYSLNTESTSQLYNMRGERGGGKKRTAGYGYKGVTDEFYNLNTSHIEQRRKHEKSARRNGCQTAERHGERVSFPRESSFDQPKSQPHP